MKTLTDNLLRKVKKSIGLRDTHPEDYIEAFRQADTFITATINGQLEFVPLELLFLNHNKFQILMEVKAVFGEGVEHPQLDDLLIKFYNDHNLKRDIERISASVKYHIKPRQQSEPANMGIIDWQQLNRLAAYAGQPYKASDPTLKAIGEDFANFIMHPTNAWGELVLPDGYVLEKERYWQVAGYYKSFTWAKIKHQQYADKQLFFSVGIDIAAAKLVFKLDCLRSGTHKLSNADIRKFDYYTENLHCVTEVDQTLGEAIGWEEILRYSRQFIKEYAEVYLGVAAYIRDGKVNLQLFKDKLFNILPENAARQGGQPGALVPDLLFNTILDGVVRYEQFMLSHAEKADLAALVKFSFDKLTHIDSFEFDGQHKRIYVVAHSGSVNTPFPISEELRQQMIDDDHTYLYQVYDYNEETNCGRLVIRKGDPRQWAKLTPTQYQAVVK